VPLPDLIHLEAVLKRFRRLRDLTQRDVEERTGVPGSQLSGYENGRYLPQLPRLWKLLDAYGVDLDDLERSLRERAEQDRWTWPS